MSYASATKYSEERNGSSGCPGSNMSFGTPANSQMPVRSGWLESRIEEIESIVAGTGKGGHSREELKQTRARIFRLEGALDKALSFGDANGCKESHLLALSDASFALYKAHGDGVSGDAAAELAFTEDRVVQQKAKEKLDVAKKHLQGLIGNEGDGDGSTLEEVLANYQETLPENTGGEAETPPTSIDGVRNVPASLMNPTQRNLVHRPK